MKLMQTVRAVLWSFVGLRDRDQSLQDQQSVSLLGILLVGFLAAVLFVAVLIFVVNLVV